MFITLQKNYRGKDKDYRRSFAVQPCGGEPFEIALRFAGCCLRCGPCFASGYAWLNKFMSNRRVTSELTVDDAVSDYKAISYLKRHHSYNWLRILGGEPLLCDKYVTFLFDTLVKIAHLNGRKFNNGVIIQTNGICIGQGNVSLLEDKLGELFDANPNIKVCIEVSIKGTNEEEFRLISRLLDHSKQDLAHFKSLFGWDSFL